MAHLLKKWEKEFRHMESSPMCKFWLKNWIQMTQMCIGVFILKLLNSIRQYSQKEMELCCWWWLKKDKHRQLYQGQNPLLIKIIVEARIIPRCISSSALLPCSSSYWVSSCGPWERTKAQTTEWKWSAWQTTTMFMKICEEQSGAEDVSLQSSADMRETPETVDHRDKSDACETLLQQNYSSLRVHESTSTKTKRRMGRVNHKMVLCKCLYSFCCCFSCRENLFF